MSSPGYIDQLSYFRTKLSRNHFFFYRGILNNIM